jgi:hypothetical protein
LSTLAFVSMDSFFARLAGRHLGRLWRQAGTAGLYVCGVTEPSIQRA